MVVFASVGGVLLAEGHDVTEDDLRNGLAANVSQASATVANLTETWYSDKHGFGHDCALHSDVDKALWSPGCGTFRAVTIATGVPKVGGVERASAAVGLV